MEKLISEIKERIEFEKLLFSNKKYNKEEEKIIIKGAAKNLKDNIYFLDLALLFMPKVIEITSKYINEEDLKEELKIINYSVRKWNLKSEREKINDSYMVDYLYGTLIGLPNNKSYFNFIQDSVMDAKNVRVAFDYGYECEYFKHFTNFMLTNNFLLSQYPNFYNEDDLNKLEEIARDKDKSKFKQKEDYRNFKKAANATLNLIRKQKRKDNERIKLLKKQKH